jgi:hypothetical protein
MTGTANELDLAVQLMPPRISDDAGVPLSVHHLEFIGRTAQHLADWRARRSPLGMSPAVYREFCEALFQAASLDGLSAIDVRLKGSAAVIYSGRHKQLPATWTEVVAEFNRVRGRPPTSTEENDLRQSYDKLWSLQSWPRRRPYDSMHKLNLDTHPSDYDIQVSSDDIENRCKAILRLGLLPPRPLNHPQYGFLDDKLVALAAPQIAHWANSWTRKLNRTVAVKAFGGAGPQNQTSTIGELSAHFRAQDWILKPPVQGVD